MPENKKKGGKATGVLTEFKEVEVEKLKPYINNSKIHTSEQLEKLQNSIKEFGFLSPCIIDKNYTLLQGTGVLWRLKI